MTTTNIVYFPPPVSPTACEAETQAAIMDADAAKLALFERLVRSLNSLLGWLPTAEEAEATERPFMAKKIREASEVLVQALDVIDPQETKDG